jgi:hypothetical protein
VIADEGDPADQRRLALVDLEHDVHPVLFQADDLRLDARIEPPAAGIKVQYALPVGLSQSGREDRARTKLQLAAELIFLFPSKTIRLTIGFSTTLTTSVSPWRLRLTSWKSPVA